MITIRLLGSFLTHTARVIAQNLLAFFRFTEEDARILASAYRYYPPEMDQLRYIRDNEYEENAATPRKVRRDSGAAPTYGQIPLGVHPELTSVGFNTASRKHVRWRRQV